MGEEETKQQNYASPEQNEASILFTMLVSEKRHPNHLSTKLIGF